MSKPWTVQTCFDCAGNSKHVEAGDTLTLTEHGDPAILEITRNGQTILDVRISPPILEPGGFSFSRHSRRGSHSESDHFRGHLAVLPTAKGCEEVLQLILGYKRDIPGSDDDDDDTEVVVATKPAGA